MKTVLQKYIADSGHCSRRQAEKLIRESRVFVNGKLAELGMKVDDKDEVKIGEKNIRPTKKKVYIKLNKPIGYTCTNKNFKGEKNVFELLKESSLRGAKAMKQSQGSLQRSRDCFTAFAIAERLFVVGRLDKNSRGLVILTNNGDWAERMAHPRYGHEKIYEVEIKSKKEKVESDKVVKNFKKGIDIGEEDGVVRAKEIEYLKNNKFKIILTEGKKRQIRRMFGALGYRVEDLKRIQVGEIELGDLKEGEWEYFEI